MLYLQSHGEPLKSDHEVSIHQVAKVRLCVPDVEGWEARDDVVLVAHSCGKQRARKVLQHRWTKRLYLGVLSEGFLAP